MTEARAEPAALRPLWALAISATAAATLAWWLPTAGPRWLPPLVTATGAAVFLVALRLGRRAATALWLAAGFALAAGPGLAERARRLDVENLIESDTPVALRCRVEVREGWSRGRWGWRTRVAVRSADWAGRPVPLPRRGRLEVRGAVDPRSLPTPGSVIDVLVAVRGEAASPLLVASSPRLMRPVPGAAGRWSAWRDASARRLLLAAGHDVERLRAAELAATLALGRRDLVPELRRDAWRRSGLAHVLAVSGLHVGLVAGMAWLVATAFRASPTVSRLILLAVLPGYAVMAGAAPSAVRAAVMGMVFLAARLAGRALVPMAAVLLTAFVMILARPALVADVSFQLTVVLTAALVRWAPVAVDALPGPRWLGAAVAVPVIAQVAAAPLVAHHFTAVIPGAAAANLAVPWLLAPVVLASVAAAAAAPFCGAVAGLLLDLVHLGAECLWSVGAPGRARELVPPEIPAPLLIAVALLGIAALLPARPGRYAAAGYLSVLAVAGAWWWAVPTPATTEVELLPVSDGLAARVSAGGSQVLMDGGSRRREAAAALAGARVRRLDAVVVSHGDSDHVTGLELVLRTVATERLLLPTWLRSRPEIVPLLRLARRRGTAVVPVARGTRVDLGGPAVDVLWPPADGIPGDGNESSVVARIDLGPAGAVLLTADIGRATEARLAASSRLAAAVLVVPHHGSRHSTSSALLDAVAPAVALIPAGPDNLHHHPHPSVVARLQERGIRYRMPIRDGLCGARFQSGRWRPYPHRDGEREPHGSAAVHEPAAPARRR